MHDDHPPGDDPFAADETTQDVAGMRRVGVYQTAWLAFLAGLQIARAVHSLVLGLALGAGAVVALLAGVKARNRALVVSARDRGLLFRGPASLRAEDVVASPALSRGVTIALGRARRWGAGLLGGKVTITPRELMWSPTWFGRKFGARHLRIPWRGVADVQVAGALGPADRATLVLIFADGSRLAMTTVQEAFLRRALLEAGLAALHRDHDRNALPEWTGAPSAVLAPVLPARWAIGLPLVWIVTAVFLFGPFETPEEPPALALFFAVPFLLLMPTVVVMAIARAGSAARLSALTAALGLFVVPFDMGRHPMVAACELALFVAVIAISLHAAADTVAAPRHS